MCHASSVIRRYSFERDSSPLNDDITTTATTTKRRTRQCNPYKHSHRCKRKVKKVPSTSVLSFLLVVLLIGFFTVTASSSGVSQILPLVAADPFSSFSSVAFASNALHQSSSLSSWGKSHDKHTLTSDSVSFQKASSSSRHRLFSLLRQSQYTSSTSCFQYHKQQEQSVVSEHSSRFSTHYNEALLKRIISGRTSSSSRWRRRTKRAAATLGFGNVHNGYCDNNHTLRGNVLAFQKGPQDLFSSWSSTIGNNGKRINVDTNSENPSSSTSLYSSIYVSRPVPPLTSIVLKSTASADENDTSNATTETKSMTKNTNPNKPTTPKIIRFLRRQKLSPSQHQAAKLDWASKYTSIDVLRQSFGTNRNKFWGDFDTKTTRKLYHTLLPRALLGLYEAGLWCPTDLAPLAFEARLAAKKYARERCVLPGRVMAMIYDGYRSWRSWGTWSVEGMSWEQVWNKYETQILEEYMEDNQGHVDLEELQEEITARICVRILERSCITNEQVDKLFLKEDGDLSRSTRANTKNDVNTLSRSQKRRRKAERELARIKNGLERDVQELQLMELQRRQRINNNSSKIPFLMDILNGFLPSEENGSATLSIHATTNGSSADNTSTN